MFIASPALQPRKPLRTLPPALPALIAVLPFQSFFPCVPFPLFPLFFLFFLFYYSIIIGIRSAKTSCSFIGVKMAGLSLDCNATCTLSESKLESTSESNAPLNPISISSPRYSQEISSCAEIPYSKSCADTTTFSPVIFSLTRFASEEHTPTRFITLKNAVRLISNLCGLLGMMLL